MVSDLWNVSPQLLLEKISKTIKKKLSIHNLWRILWTKLNLLVDFWGHISKQCSINNVFSSSSLISRMSRNMCILRHKVRNGQKISHESQNLSNFMDNLGNFSRNLRPHYQNSFFLLLFSTLHSRMPGNRRTSRLYDWIGPVRRFSKNAPYGTLNLLECANISPNIIFWREHPTREVMSFYLSFECYFWMSLLNITVGLNSKTKIVMKLNNSNCDKT